MSGGHFDYGNYRMHDWKDQIEHLIETNDSDEKNSWGDAVGYHYPPEIIAKFRKAVELLTVLDRLMHHIDYLVSGDYGEDSFLRACKIDNV